MPGSGEEPGVETTNQAGLVPGSGEEPGVETTNQAGLVPGWCLVKQGTSLCC